MRKLLKSPLLIIALAVLLFLAYSMFYSSRATMSAPHPITRTPVVPPAQANYAGQG